MEYKYGSYGVQRYGGNLVRDGVLADFPLVGSNVKATDELCNVFSRNLGCLQSHKHVGVVVPDDVFGQRTFDGKVGGDMAVIHVRAYHCSDPLCPVCCLSWAKKETKRALMRFEVFDDVFGEGFELCHVTVSVPEFDWNKSLKFLRSQAINFVCAVGVVGSMCIYHPKRYDERLDCWFFSPHFHFVGFVEGGHVDGGVVRDVHNLSGYVLKNLDKRKSVVGTIMYQLSHAGIPFGREHAVVWCGELNYRKSVHPDLLELVKANEYEGQCKAKNKLCPVCGGVMVHVCRSVNSVPFDYKSYEDKYVLDSVDNWVKVDVPVRSKFSDDG